MERNERGSAIVDFVLVCALTTLLFAGVLQLALAQHVRNTLVDCAGEGARYAASADRAPVDGERRTRELIDGALGSRYSGTITARETTIDGLDVVEIEVRAPLPVVGLAGPTTLKVRGHGLEESP